MKFITNSINVINVFVCVSLISVICIKVWFDPSTLSFAELLSFWFIFILSKIAKNQDIIIQSQKNLYKKLSGLDSIQKGQVGIENKIEIANAKKSSRGSLWGRTSSNF